MHQQLWVSLICYFKATDDDSLQVLKHGCAAQLVLISDLGFTFTPLLWAVSNQEHILAKYILMQYFVHTTAFPGSQYRLE